MIQNEIMTTLALMMRQPFLLFAAQMGERTDSSFATLQLLNQETDVTAGRISEHLDIKPSSVTQLIKKLEEGGLVERRKSEQDARVTYVDLTEQGHQLAVSQTEDTVSLQNTLFAGLTEEELQQFYHVLTQLNDQLSSQEFRDLVQSRFGEDRRWRQFSKMSAHFERSREQMMHGDRRGGGVFRQPFGDEHQGGPFDGGPRRFFRHEGFGRGNHSERRGKRM